VNQTESLPAGGLRTAFVAKRHTKRASSGVRCWLGKNLARRIGRYAAG
jgi:hypothetical protein